MERIISDLDISYISISFQVYYQTLIFKHRFFHKFSVHVLFSFSSYFDQSFVLNCVFIFFYLLTIQNSFLTVVNCIHCACVRSSKMSLIICRYICIFYLRDLTFSHFGVWWHLYLRAMICLTVRSLQPSRVCLERP